VIVSASEAHVVRLSAEGRAAPQSRPSDQAQRAAKNKPRLTRQRCGGRVRCSARLGVVSWSQGTRGIVVPRVRPTEIVIEVAAAGRSNITVLKGRDPLMKG
jgi:hypothetical protein